MPQSAKSTEGFYEENENRSPLAKKIRMPQLPGNEDGRLVRWHVSGRSRVKLGDILAEIETDSTTYEIEATAEGIVEYILIPAGPKTIRPGTPLVLIIPAAMESSDSHKADGNTRTIVQISNRNDPEPATATAPGREEPPEDEGLVTPRNKMGPTRTATYRETLGSVIAEEMRREPSLFVMGHGAHQTPGADHVLQGMAEEFGRTRVVDVPIAESPMAGIAVGAALGGQRPIIVFSSWTAGREALTDIMETLTTFARIDSAQLALPIVFRAPSEDGKDAAWLSLIPSLTVAAPSTPAAAQGLLRAALRGSGPVAVIENPTLYAVSGDVPDDSESTAQFGQAHIARVGNDVTIATYGAHVPTALDAAERAATNGISIEIIDLMTLVPLDSNTIARSVEKTGRLLTFEEAGTACAIGQRIVGRLASDTPQDTSFTPICVDDAVLFARSEAGTKPPAEVLADLAAILKSGGPAA